MRLLFASLGLTVAALSLNGCGSAHHEGKSDGPGGKNGTGGSMPSAGTGGNRATGGSDGSTAGTGGSGASGASDGSGTSGGTTSASTGGSDATAGESGNGGSTPTKPGTCEGYSLQLFACGIVDKPYECTSAGSDPSAACYYGCYQFAECAPLVDNYCNDAENSVDDCLTACDTFPCGDGSSVASLYTCDGTMDCTNGADEKGCVTAPPFQCKNGETVDGADRCDDYEDCSDGSDEAGCPVLTCPRPSAPTPGVACRDAAANLEACGLFVSMPGCLDRTEARACKQECFAQSSCNDTLGFFCGSTSDGAVVQKCIDDCYKLSDAFPCKAGNQTVSGNYVCDGYPDCDDQSDEDDCAFHCKTGGQSVALGVVCDDYPDCSDGSDESGCKPECAGPR
jgi:hypothetical protein